jgi:hypothetical protein
MRTQTTSSSSTDGAYSETSLQVGSASPLTFKNGTTKSRFAKVASAFEHMLQGFCAAADDSVAIARKRERVKIFMF